MASTTQVFSHADSIECIAAFDPQAQLRTLIPLFLFIDEETEAWSCFCNSFKVSQVESG
jgi:hypothetical protein